MDEQNIVPPSVEPGNVTPEPVNPQNFFVANKTAIAVVFFIFTVAIISMAFLVLYYRQISLNSNPVPTPTPIPAVQGMPSPSLQPSLSPQITPAAFSEMIDVNWEKAWLFQPKRSCAPNDYDCESAQFYLVGKILSGAYSNQPVYIEEIQSMGTYYRYYVIQDNDIKYLDDLKIGFRGIDDAPQFINFPVKPGYRLKKSYVSEPFAGIKKVRKVFTDPVLGDFYLTESGCLIVELPNHLALSYDLDIPFANPSNGAISMTLISGFPNSDFYTFNQPTCFSMCYYLSIIEENVLRPGERLSKIGTTSDGEDIFGIKDTNDSELKNIYEDKNTVAYYADDWAQLPQNKYTYEQFIAANPLIYWKDPLGRWIQFRNNKFIIAAEMCKPVIYLYPEKATEMTVKVHPNGGFTFTKPAYEDAWHVIAYPDGKIKDLRTGQMYDYLFWEGIGLNYPEDDKGWSVKRESLNGFFDEKLTILGLNGKESEDFKNYWLGRLSEKPYYKISFLRKEEFNQIAPLELSKNPNTVIRIMMTVRGLGQPIDIEPQELTKPADRSGFTLVEWGGVVLK